VRLYTWRRTGLADEGGSDAIPDAAGGEGGHGAAKPEGVIHRLRFLPGSIHSDDDFVIACPVQNASNALESACGDFAKMINAVLVFNNNGQPRLTKFYSQLVIASWSR
jgi:hypothetical protein